jgi:hypothetical protein
MPNVVDLLEDEVGALRARVAELEELVVRCQVPVIQAGYSGLGFEIGKAMHRALPHKSVTLETENRPRRQSRSPGE